MTNHHFWKKISSAFAVFTTVFLLGCAAIHSTRHTGSGTDSGLAYYLPKGLLKITVGQEIIMKTTGDTNKPETLTYVPSRTNISITTDFQLVPDRHLMYVLKMKPSWMADDYMKLGVTNGLLQTVTLSNADQSIGVITNLAAAAIEAYKLYATGGFAPAGAEAYTNIITDVFIIDPFNPAERDKTTKDFLANYGVDIDFSDFAESFEPTTNAICTSGIFYRPMQAYRLKWNSSSGSDAVALNFPNASPILSMNVSRAAFVTQSYILGIQDGIPYEVVLNKPSQALAISAVPLSIVRAVAALPSEILQLKLDYSTKSSALLQARTAQITNLQAELAAQQQLAIWRATNINTMVTAIVTNLPPAGPPPSGPSTNADSQPAIGPKP